MPPNKQAFYGAAMSNRSFIQIAIVCLYVTSLAACSLNKLTNHFSSLFIENKIESLNTEHNLYKVEKELPINIASLEKNTWK